MNRLSSVYLERMGREDGAKSAEVDVAEDAQPGYDHVV